MRLKMDIGKWGGVARAKRRVDGPPGQKTQSTGRSAHAGRI